MPQDPTVRYVMIGEKQLWGRGYGTEAIGLLTDYGFRHEGADLVFGCDISQYNPRSRRAFEKCGYTVDAVIQKPSGNKSTVVYDLVARPPRPGKPQKRRRMQC